MVSGIVVACVENATTECRRYHYDTLVEPEAQEEIPKRTRVL
jgi:hypothetical protein